MALHVSITPVLGLPQYDGWAQIVQNQSKNLICAVSVAGTNAGNIGREVVSRLESFASTDPQDLYTVITSLQQEVHQKECQLQLACGLFDDGKATFASLAGSVMLKRDGKVGALLQVDDNSQEIQLVSGTAQAEDIVILLTNQAKGFAEEIEQKLAQGFDIDTIITSIVPALHRKSDSAKSALAFVSLRQPKRELEASLSSSVNSTTTDAEIRQNNQQNQVEQMASSTQHQPDTTRFSSEEPTTSHSFVKERSASIPGLNHDPQQVSQTKSERDELHAELRSATRFQNQDEATQAALSSFSPLKSRIGEQGIKPTAAPAWDVSAPPPYTRIEPRQAPMMVILEQITKFLQKIGTQLKNFFKKNGNNASGSMGTVNLSGNSSTTKRPPLKVLLPFIFIITAAALGGWWYQSTVLAQRAEAAALVEPLLQQVEEARSNFEADPVSSRKSVEEVIQKLNDFESNFEDKQHAKVYVQEQKDVVEAYYQEISGKEEVSSLDAFYDLRFALDGFIASAADATSETAFFLDKDQRSVVQLSWETKEIITGSFEESDQPIEVAFTGEQALLLGNGLFTLEESDGSFQPIRLRDDETELSGGTLIDHFGRFLYVFHPEDRTIYRFAPESTTQYAAPTEWLRDKQDLEFDLVTSMAIDGDLWLGTRDGKIFKYRSGNRESFEIDGLSDPFTSRLVVFTNEEDENIYVLESDKKRLVVLSKDGDYIKEVASDSLASATTILVREDQNKAYAVSGAEIFEVEL